MITKFFLYIMLLIKVKVIKKNTNIVFRPRKNNWQSSFRNIKKKTPAIIFKDINKL